jgi:hypothetical protein
MLSGALFKCLLYSYLFFFGGGGCHLREKVLSLTAGGHAHRLGGGTAAAANSLHRLHDVVALQHLTEHDVLAVQPARGGRAEEELRAVRVGASVGHRQRTRTEVLAGLAGERLISKLVAVDGLAARAIAGGEVATLAHELRNHAVERRAGVAEALLTRAERAEVLGGLGDGISEQLHRHATSGLATNLNVHPHLGVGGDGGVVRLVGHGVFF